MVKSLKALLLFATVALFGVAGWANTTLFVEISWNSPDAPPDTPSVDISHLNPGSIVQIIGYDSTSGAVTPANAGSTGGMQQYGTHDGTPILLPNTVADGWQILETAHVQKMSGNFYSVSVAVEIPDGIDKIFVRVFSVTNFPDAPQVVEGWWGISESKDPSDTIGTGYTWFDNVAVTNHAYFEVIPEPTTFALIGSGLLAIAFRRKRKTTPDVSARSSHDEGGLS